MKLELKHLTPYSPYKLMLQNRAFPNIPIVFSGGYYKNSKEYIMSYGDDIHGIKCVSTYVNEGAIKPILRPLSGLTKYLGNTKNFESWQDEWVDHIWDFQNKLQEANALACPYDLTQKLLENHFDLFGLIDKGLAIDINTIKNA